MTGDRHIDANISAYARDPPRIVQFQADDIADEGSHLPEKRIKLLDEYEKDFRNALENIFRNGFWLVLRNTIDYNN